MCAYHSQIHSSSNQSYGFFPNPHQPPLLIFISIKLTQLCLSGPWDGYSCFYIIICQPGILIFKLLRGVSTFGIPLNTLYFLLNYGEGKHRLRNRKITHSVHTTVLCGRTSVSFWGTGHSTHTHNLIAKMMNLPYKLVSTVITKKKTEKENR